MATGNAYRTILKAFAVSEATVNEVLLQFCTALFMISPQNLKFSITEKETAMMIDLFCYSTNCSIPQVYGCLSSTHCNMICPDIDSKVDYFNKKQAYSVNTEAVVAERLKTLM